jgi:hypothetical protein
MQILVNPRQTNKIILESSFKDMSNGIKKSYELVKDVLTKTGEQINMNLSFLFTWGASIGGMVGPLNDFIQNKNPELSDVEVSLLLTGVISSYYVDNTELIKKVVKKIKEEGLSDIFSDVLGKSQELKSTFFDFIQSLNITSHKMSNILSYTFIIPLIPMIYENVSNGTFSESDITEISKRIVGFGLVTLSGLVVKELIERIIKRFKSK